MKRKNLILAALALILPQWAVQTSTAATLEATYQFNNTLAADQGGVPALVATDPLGSNTFQTDIVFGHSRTVYDTVGNSSPASQAGLSFDNSSALITNNNYSIEMVFEFLQGNNAWRRIIDVQNRQSDSGFYVDPSNNLDVYPVAGSTGMWTTGVYHDVVLTDGGGTVNAYLDGVLQFTASTTVMDINNPQNLVNFYLDNVTGGGIGEYSDARTALIRLYNGVLTEPEVADLGDPFGPSVVPEPASLALLTTGILGLAGYNFRRRKLAAV